MSDGLFSAAELALQDGLGPLEEARVELRQALQADETAFNQWRHACLSEGVASAAAAEAWAQWTAAARARAAAADALDVETSNFRDGVRAVHGD